MNYALKVLCRHKILHSITYCFFMKHSFVVLLKALLREMRDPSSHLNFRDLREKCK